MLPHRGDSVAVNRAEQIRKRLFVLCDGTRQDGVNKTRPLTNVATLARCLSPIDDDGCLQIVYYDSGVGTGTSWPARLTDGATGRGISAKIRNAYSFLSHNYNFDRACDEIVLVGYSRGAFAVQCLAAFISDAGLLKKEQLYYLRGLFTLWSHREMSDVGEKFQNEKESLRNAGLLHPIDVKACAVWDTVSSLGIGIQIPPRPLSFVGREVPERVQNAFQALALDETRRVFRPIVWQEPAQKEACVHQCWFLGSHSDVGGNGDAALGMMTFLWMVGMLRDKVGVKFTDEEIVRHLKHKFLEWNFAVNKVCRTFNETRELSARPHTGNATVPSWYWYLLGWSSRASLLTQPSVLPTKIHFTVRLAMAHDEKASKCLRSWSTAWPDNAGFVPAVVKWQPLGSRNNRDTSSILKESVLARETTEHKFLQGWSRDELPVFRTDRHEFVRLQEAVQAPGTTPAMGKFKELLREKMVFSNNGKLAEATLYNENRQR